MKKVSPQTASVAVLLAPGFEEIEAITIIDVLRRAHLPTVTLSVGCIGSVEGSHGLRLEADAALEDARGKAFDMVALPGGMPGSEHLAGDPAVLHLLRTTAERGAWTAALCAAPLALHAAGLLADGRRVTAYPSVACRLTGATYTGARVETDGRIITGAGPGAALEFALALVAALDSSETADSLQRAMLAPSELCPRRSGR